MSKRVGDIDGESEMDFGLEQLPKIDLHCHLDGSLPVEYLKSTLEKQGEEREINGAQRTKQPYTNQDFQVKDDCRDLAEYLEKFDLPLQTLQTREDLKQGAYHFIKGVEKDHVAYVEVRFAPLLSKDGGLPTEQIIEAVLAGLEWGRKDFGVESNVIVCAMRHHSAQDNIQMLKAAREFLGNGVCAADLAGNEAAFPMMEFRQVFETANQLKLPYTIHAGECGSVNNIRDAVEIGAKRIGHGIAMAGYSELQRLLADKHIGVEMCPISNLQTKAVTEAAKYPLMEFLENGVLATINTDNRTVSNTSMKKELHWVQKNCLKQVQSGELELMEYGELVKRLMRNAVEVSFASDDIKDKLWKLYK